MGALRLPALGVPGNSAEEREGTFQRASHRGQGPGKVPLSVGEEAGTDSQPSELGVSTGEGPLEMPGKT